MWARSVSYQKSSGDERTGFRGSCSQMFFKIVDLKKLKNYTGNPLLMTLIQLLCDYVVKYSNNLSLLFSFLIS